MKKLFKMPVEALSLDDKILPQAPVSRLAPTPSGFLHIGNALNFLVTWVIVRTLKGTLHLRIDDMDGIRFRQDVLEDIFYCLDWLGVDWDMGPEGPDEFYQTFSLQKKKDNYRDQLKKLMSVSDKPFVCQCSRSDIKKISSDGRYPGTCRKKGLVYEPGRCGIRIEVTDTPLIRVNEIAFDLAEALGDFVIWRKDDQPSYHLASLIEDEHAGVSLIVRGEDLYVSTAAQIYLARCFGYSRFPACRFIHHGLVCTQDGQKLSKSRGAHALKEIRQAGKTPVHVVRAAARILGLDENAAVCANDLLLLAANQQRFR